RREHGVDAALDLERIRPRGADDRAAAREDPGDLAGPERLEASVDEPGPALADADHLVAARLRATRDRADDRVQPRGVPAAGQHAYALGHATIVRVAPRAMPQMVILPVWTTDAVRRCS